jgi:hypothetical protein
MDGDNTSDGVFKASRMPFQASPGMEMLQLKRGRNWQIGFNIPIRSQSRDSGFIYEISPDFGEGRHVPRFSIAAVADRFVGAGGFRNGKSECAAGCQSDHDLSEEFALEAGQETDFRAI